MPDFLEILRHRLLELGCPRSQARRLVGEVADHRDDLKQAALAEGWSAAEAEARADAALGDPLVLADQQMAVLRRSNWCGRHYVVTFGLLPVLVYPVLWLVFLLVQLALEITLKYGWNNDRLHAIGDNPVAFQRVLILFQLMDYTAVALAAFCFCSLARRAMVGFKWMLTTGILCSVLAMLTWCKIEPHNFSIGFSASWQWHQPWWRGAIPPAMVGAFYFFQRLQARRRRVTGAI